MSYCRWSSDNFKCDIYAYHSENGYTIHVASNKIIEELPKVDFGLLLKKPQEIDEYMKQAKLRDDAMKKVTRVAIGLPYDGDSFDCDTLEVFYVRMIELREIGYNFPDYVLEEIKCEIQQNQ